MIKQYAPLSLILVLFFWLGLSFHSTIAFAQEQEATMGKPVTLLVFSGSDWCVPCIKFDRQVLQDETFQSFAKENLHIEIADFPQHKKLAKTTVQHNEALAEKYNPNGYFPLVLLLDKHGKVLTEIVTNKATPDMVIKQIRPYLPAGPEELSASLLLMGSSFQITIVANKKEGMALLAEAINEIQGIESWLSSWQEGSVTTRLNKQAGKEPQKVPADYYALLKRCLALSDLTQGAFDISFNGLGELYTFDKQEHALPDKEAIREALQHIGYKKIKLLPDNRVFFEDSLLTIGFGAIGKGYAADQVKQFLKAKGVTGGVINASGDLTTWGKRANGDNWQVGIPDPVNNEHILLHLPMADKAIATSGDYEKYFTHQGVRYSHIINPKTGLPVVGASSVSIISNSGELSDALATAVSVLGLELGMDLVNQLDDVECVFIDNNRKLHFSKGLQHYAK